MNIQLLPCPFCGCKEVHVAYSSYTSDPEGWITCPDCDGDLPVDFVAPYEGNYSLYFSKDDLILMLSRFNS